MRQAPLFLGFFALLLLVSCTSQRSRWPALDPAEFRRSEALVDPGAGAEILLRESVAQNSPVGFEVRHLVRARVFSPQGVELLSRIDIPYERSFDILDVEARTLRKDGSVLKVRSRDIVDRESVGVGNLRTRAKSFAPPGLEPGAVVEYRYTEFTDTMMQYLPIFFQGSLPARTVRHKVRPFAPPTSGLRALFFNFPPRDLTADPDGYLSFELNNIQAARDEPYRPPAVQSQPVVILYHTDAGATPPAQYWTLRGINLHRESLASARVTPEIAALAATVVKSADSPEDRLRALYDHCRLRITNRNRETSGFTAQQRQKLGNNTNAAETLRKGHGSPSDVNALFLALARAAGFDAHAVLANDRSFFLYDEKMIEPFVFTDSLVAVRVGEDWSFHDPGSIYLPAGMVPWQNSDTSALIADDLDPSVREVPGAPAAASLRARKGSFKLTAGGTLEGQVTIEYTGLWGAEMKRVLEPDSPTARAARVRQELIEQLPGAEVTAVGIDHAGDLLKPLRVSFHLKIPGYADRAGTRLFLQPAVLQKGETPRFEASFRSSDVALNYRFTEIDELEIALPAGFKVEAAPAGSEIDMGLFGQYQIEYTHREEGPASFSCRRRLVVNDVLVERPRYPSLKAAFDEIHVRDNRTVRLARLAAASRGP